MRVISGDYRGKVLNSPKNDAVRPTTDKVKEAVFNILANRIDGAAWLDLFGGAGGMGIEALSRGAESATFVDAAKDSFRLIKSNLECVGVSGGEVLYGDAIVVAKRFGADGRQFDLIYIDPPYASDLDEKALRAVANNRLVKENGLVLVEHERKTPPTAEGLTLTDDRRYGRVHISVYKKETL